MNTWKNNIEFGNNGDNRVTFGQLINLVKPNLVHIIVQNWSMEIPRNGDGNVDGDPREGRHCFESGSGRSYSIWSSDEATRTRSL